MQDQLQDVNSCLSRYDVTLYRGTDGKYRIWGDINRIQDIVDGPCAELLPPGARTDLDTFFADEVDVTFAAYAAQLGVPIDLQRPQGPEGPQLSDEQADECYRRTWGYFRSPPEQRSEAPQASS